jgi:hypothetical protein
MMILGLPSVLYYYAPLSAYALGACLTTTKYWLAILVCCMFHTCPAASGLVVLQLRLKKKSYDKFQEELKTIRYVWVQFSALTALRSWHFVSGKPRLSHSSLLLNWKTLLARKTSLGKPFAVADQKGTRPRKTAQSLLISRAGLKDGSRLVVWYGLN